MPCSLRSRMGMAPGSIPGTISTSWARTRKRSGPNICPSCRKRARRATDMTKEVDFGFRKVAEEEKAKRVGEVFDRVAERYDLMNDLMSLGLHRVWKHFAVSVARPRPGERVLDVASGSGDLAAALARRVGAQGEVWATDVNRKMLERGRDRLLDAGALSPAVQCHAQRLPLPAAYLDCGTVGFGLRTMTHKDRALAEMARVLKPGGRVVVLEVSKVWAPLAGAYDVYSFKVLPWLGERVAGAAEPYRYLAESIRMHPDQAQLKEMMERAGFSQVEVFNLAAGVVAVHRGLRF